MLNLIKEDTINHHTKRKMRVSDFMKIGIYYEIIRYYVLAIFFVNMLYAIFKEFIWKLEIKIYDDIYEMIYKKICPIFPLVLFAWWFILSSFQYTIVFCLLLCTHIHSDLYLAHLAVQGRILGNMFHLPGGINLYCHNKGNLFYVSCLW